MLYLRPKPLTQALSPLLCLPCHNGGKKERAWDWGLEDPYSKKDLPKLHVHAISSVRAVTGVVVSEGDYGLSQSPDLHHCVVFLGNTLYSHAASTCPGVNCVLANLIMVGPSITKSIKNIHVAYCYITSVLFKIIE